MQRFYVTFPLSIDLEITDSNIYHQLTRVMRVKPGDHVIFFDGDRSEYEYEIREITKQSLLLRCMHRRFPKTENEKYITLYQAIPNKLEKIEYIIEKGVEVGISRFVFFRSDHSQKIILSEGKKIRIETIAREALEQCGGLVMPIIEFVERITNYEGGTINFVLDTIGPIQNMRAMYDNQKINIWVGPEGGWSDKERVEMKNNGFIFVRFGERILRTETAGVVTAFAFLHG